MYQRCPVVLLVRLFYNSQASFLLLHGTSSAVITACLRVEATQWSLRKPHWRLLDLPIKWGLKCTTYCNYRGLFLLHLLWCFYSSLWYEYESVWENIWVGKHLHAVKVWHHITASLDVDVVWPYVWYVRYIRGSCGSRGRVGSPLFAGSILPLSKILNPKLRPTTRPAPCMTAPPSRQWCVWLAEWDANRRGL